MAISQRVQLLSDNAYGVSILAEYLKNPKLVDQLMEDIKRLNSLTEQEEQKTSAARASIITYEGLKKQQDKLDLDKSAHEKNVVDFDQIKASHAEEIQKQKDDLADKSSKLEESIKQHKKNASDLQIISDDLSKKHAAAIAELNAEKLAVAKVTEANETKATYLAKTEQALKEKAGKVNALLAE